ncbi:glycine betaine ABC transporter substrate-binding protein [Streptomyces sp. T-3]|nr:glycine betaine ABC transporter substrate-binding protein [Streptomyces sp. T-3]
MRRTRGMRRMRCLYGAVAGFALVLSGCGLHSGSPLIADVSPGSIGKGEPLKGADLTVTSKEFTEQLILGQIMGIAFKAAGADVLDRTGIQGSIGAREAVKGGDADGMYEYTGTSWITYLGNTEPIDNPQKQWQAVHDQDLKNGITWLPPAKLNNTYSLAMNQANAAKYKTKTLSDVAALAKKDPKAVTLCVNQEFASRDDGLPGMQKAYGMDIPPSNIKAMDAGIIYTQVSSGNSCTYGMVFTTDGRIKAMDLVLTEDDKNFFPNYNAAPMLNSDTFKEYPAIADVLDPITAKLDNATAQELNAKVDVDGQDPHDVALDWLVREGFVKKG